MRPRAKSFIRSIGQIEANRQKFSLSMTSEVRKCLKMAKSGQKRPKFFPFLSAFRLTLSTYLWCINEMCALVRRSYIMRENDPPIPVFEKNAETSFFGKKCYTIIAIVLLSISRRFDEINEQFLHRWNLTVHAVWVLGRFSRSYVESIYYESKGAERKLINRLLWISEIRQTFAVES